MSTSLANSRKSVDHVVSAFVQHRTARAGGKRYFTDGTVLEVWGNVVARWLPEGIRISDCGWKTNLTKQMLNAILNAVGSPWSIGQKKFAWYLAKYSADGKEEKKDWKGEALIKVSEGTVMNNGGNELVLQSANWVYAPGLLKWIQHGYSTSSGKQKKMFATLVSGTWHGVPQKVGLALAQGKYPYKIKGEDIIIHVKGSSKKNCQPNKPRFKKNMMSVDDARFLIGQSRRIIRDPKLRTSLFLLGKAAGMTYAAGATGPQRTSSRAARIGRAVAKYAKVIPNGLKGVLGNLHTKREIEHGKRLVQRYFTQGLQALKRGLMARAAHAYGALAAIRRIALFERPAAQTVANHASFCMDRLRYQVKVVKGGRSWKHNRK
jgi:hypothetical protein